MAPETTVVRVGEVRTARIAERILTARLVPYGETSFAVPDPGGERFLPDSLTGSLHRWATARRPLKLFRSHQHHEAVGLAIGYDPTAPSGPTAEFRIGRTAAGDSVLHEVAEGLLDSISVGFRAVRERRGRDGAREIVEAALLEVSILPLAAYGGAQVLAVRGTRLPDRLSAHRLPPAPHYDPDAGLLPLTWPS